jgi:hypothetical protein
VGRLADFGHPTSTDGTAAALINIARPYDDIRWVDVNLTTARLLLYLIKPLLVVSYISTSCGVKEVMFVRVVQEAVLVKPICSNIAQAIYSI